MLSLLLSFFTIVLLLVSLFLILLILMQRASANAGLGSAFGGAVTEGAFGAQAGNVLNRATIVCTVIFFVISFGLYLIHLNLSSKNEAQQLPTLEEIITEPLPQNLPSELEERAIEQPVIDPIPAQALETTPEPGLLNE